MVQPKGAQSLAFQVSSASHMRETRRPGKMTFQGAEAPFADSPGVFFEEAVGIT